jgi:hypothetical protein
MPRPLFTLAALLSLLLCVAVAVLWVRSVYAYDVLTFVRDADGGSAWVRRLLDFRSLRGGLAIGYYRSRMTDAEGVASFRRSAPAEPRVLHTSEPPRPYPLGDGADPAGRWAHWLGFQLAQRNIGLSRRSDVWHSTLVFPYWAPTALCSIVPLLWLRRRFWHTVPAGHCQSCGYDLRETQQRCPECGREGVVNG